MADLQIDWLVTDGVSVFQHARALGFDLSKYEKQKPEVQAAVKKATIDSIVDDVCYTWREAGRDSDYYAVSRGVYVISISDGFGIKYGRGASEVLYIGRGTFSKRIRSHLQNWIFDMSLSLKDVQFKFYMDEIGDGRSPESFKDFEGHLLDSFHEKFGEKPLINKIAGRQDRRTHVYSGNWSKPLDNRGKNYMWELRPSEKNSWFKQLEDE